jgi:hypothetical protein
MTEPAAVQRLLQRILVLVIKTALAPQDADASHWRNEALSLSRDLAAARSSAMPDVHLDALWQFAVAEAETPDILAEAEEVSTTMPMTCPFNFAELMAADFDLAAAVDRIRKAAATG